MSNIILTNENIDTLDQLVSQITDSLNGGALPYYDTLRVVENLAEMVTSVGEHGLNQYRSVRLESEIDSLLVASTLFFERKRAGTKEYNTLLFLRKITFLHEPPAMYEIEDSPEGVWVRLWNEKLHDDMFS